MMAVVCIFARLCRWRRLISLHYLLLSSGASATVRSKRQLLLIFGCRCCSDLHLSCLRFIWLLGHNFHGMTGCDPLRWRVVLLLLIWASFPGSVEWMVFRLNCLVLLLALKVMHLLDSLVCFDCLVLFRVRVAHGLLRLGGFGGGSFRLRLRL